MKKIVYISGTRADFGLMQRTLVELKKYFDLTIIATAMHLSERWGMTVRVIEEMGFKVRRVDMLLESSVLSGMAKSFGIGTYGITQALEELKPDLLFVEGDRGEQLAAAIAGSHLGLPILHQGGGDVSDSIDNKIRQAISIFSDYHLTGNPQSQQNLIKIGIDPQKVFMIGEPGLDEIYDKEYASKEEISAKFRINQRRKLAILVFHPNTNEYENIKTQIAQLLTTITQIIKVMNVQVVALTANSDAGGNIINDALKAFAQQAPPDCFQLYDNFTRREFLGFLNVCEFMIGNSSSGLTELPSFGKPFVCVGTRQKGRLHGENVLEVGYQPAAILEGIKIALNDENFRRKLVNMKNPYGEGKTYLKIIKIVGDILKVKISW